MDKSPLENQQLYFSHRRNRSSEILILKVIFIMGTLSFPLLVCVAMAFSQASSQGVQCKENYQEFKGSCSSLADAADPWATSEQKGALHGRDLAPIKTLEENKFVKSLYHMTNDSAVSIGGYEHPVKKSKSLRWTRVDGQQGTYRHRLLWSFDSTKSHFLFFFICLYFLALLYHHTFFCLR
ncbi:hypothetical protein AALO_G00102400 [Alosa alosa]|uniref:Uncharacterized protein n=1 Tax=Alosa alosa TaxID=278164 RepID=A0AAV6GYK9_9TELE|nr:hypothetical protein AALO_G00102400 [Alosa alosa]